MKNRLRAFLEEAEARKRPEECFWIVQCDNTWYRVSGDTARRLLDRLEGDRGRWLRFTDLFGSRIRVRPELVQAIEESTPEQRSRMRAFIKARKQEHAADHDEPWEGV